MINNNYLLTIAIPTYKRTQELEKVINNLQKQRNQSFIIQISDNDCYFDKTEKMIKKYQREMPNLLYHKNVRNLGFSGNIIKLYELAKTKYVWFLSDDDDVLTDSVDKILNVVNLYKPTVAIFNQLANTPFGEKIYGVKKDVVYTDINNFTDHTSLLRIIFISALVMETGLSLNKIKKTNYQDHIFAQVVIALVLLSHRFKFCESSSCIVYRNPGCKAGDFFKFIYVDLLKAIFSINHKFNNQKFVEISKKNFLINLQLYLSQKIGYTKFFQKPTKKTIKLIFKYYGLVHSILILSIPIISTIIPSFLLKLIYLIKLTLIFGFKKGWKLYKINTNRVLQDKRSTSFVNER